MSIYWIGDYKWQCDQCGEVMREAWLKRHDHVCKPKQRDTDEHTD